MSEKKPARQIRMPGIGPEIDPEIAELGAVFAKEGNKAKRQNEKKKLAMEKLVAKMREKKVKTYKDLEADPPIEIKLSEPKFTVKVKTIDQPDDDVDAPTQPPAAA